MKQNALIPELSVFHLGRSLKFYVDLLGFKVEYGREEEGFVFISLNKSQIMLDEIGKGRTWKTAKFEHPLGRGINLQIKVKNVDLLIKKLKTKKIKLFLDLEEKWYRKGNTTSYLGNRQFLVQDPDGYLLRFFEDLGEKKMK